MRSFIREKKIYCGKQYMEVDIYPYTKDQQEVNRRGKRARKQKESAPKQKNLNDKNARRYLTQLANTNFTESDHHITITYKDKFLPATIEEAEKEAANFLRRISYRRKKENLPAQKYIMVTEYITEKESEKPVRIHHHIFMSGGLDRNTIEDLWSKRRQKGEKKGERIGYVNADSLQPDENGLAALCAYLTKNPRGKKRWSSSQNLEKPMSSTNDSKYSRRAIEKLAKNPPELTYWETKYPGYTLSTDYGISTQYNDVTGWAIYLKLRKKPKSHPTRGE